MTGFVLLVAGIIALGGMVAIIVAVMRRTGRPNIWLSFAFIFAPIVGIVGLAVSAQGYWLLTQTTVGEVESMIHENVAIGATSDEVLDFLEERGIEHGDLSTSGYGEGTVHVVAVIHDTSRAWFSTADIAITFIFDEDGHLIDYVVEEWITSL